MSIRVTAVDRVQQTHRKKQSDRLRVRFTREPVDADIPPIDPAILLLAQLVDALDDRLRKLEQV